MLKEKEFIAYNRLSDGEAHLMLLARNQELKSLLCARKGEIVQMKFHDRVATHFRNIVTTGLHNTNSTAFSHLQAISNYEKRTVEDIISKAQKMTNPSLNLSNSVLKSLSNSANNALRSPIDSFDASPEQLTQCRSDAYLQALKEEIGNGRTFDPGTFDPNTQEVHSLPNGVLVVIKKVNLQAREQRIYENCTARVAMENIINRKVSELGNVLLYSVIHQEGHQFSWNSRVQTRLYWQEQWISTTAKATGLSEANVRLVLSNSAININEETPSETLVRTGAMLIRPGSEVPTTLPTLGGNNNGGPGFDPSNPLGSLVAASLASGNLALIIISISVLVLFEVISAIEKRRADIFKSLDDPSVIAPRCTDANEKLEGCEGGTPNGGNGNTGSNNTLLYVLGGVAVVGLIGAAISNNNSSTEQELEELEELV